MASILVRLTKFVTKPGLSQFRSFAFRWFRWSPSIPLPFYLPFGAWWLLRDNQISALLLYENYEDAGTEFAHCFLQPGMTMVDVGANQGYFTLLASRRVGREGKVIAIEPSIRDLQRLKQHLRLNRCRNVEVAACALGEAEGTADLHVVLGTETGCNSLRPPDVPQPTRPISVPVRRLDELLRSYGVDRVDFIKIDVEGAELSVLEGAGDLLRRFPRPIILAEVQDIRTKPWGYRAEEIISKLTSLNYEWFEPQRGGQLRKLPLSETYDGNFVAVPRERIEALHSHFSVQKNPLDRTSAV